MSEYRLEVRGVTKVFSRNPGAGSGTAPGAAWRGSRAVRREWCREIYPHEHHRRRVSAHGGRDLV